MVWRGQTVDHLGKLNVKCMMIYSSIIVIQTFMSKAQLLLLCSYFIFVAVIMIYSSTVHNHTKTFWFCFCC